MENQEDLLECDKEFISIDSVEESTIEVVGEEIKPAETISEIDTTFIIKIIE